MLFSVHSLLLELNKYKFVNNETKILIKFLIAYIPFNSHFSSTSNQKLTLLHP